MAIPPLTSVQSTRVITLVAPEKREHARWVLALDESKSWKEEVETEVKGSGGTGVGGARVVCGDITHGIVMRNHGPRVSTVVCVRGGEEDSHSQSRKMMKE